MSAVLLTAVDSKREFTVRSKEWCISFQVCCSASSPVQAFLTLLWPRCCSFLLGVQALCQWGRVFSIGSLILWSPENDLRGAARCRSLLMCITGNGTLINLPREFWILIAECVSFHTAVNLIVKKLTYLIGGASRLDHLGMLEVLVLLWKQICLGGEKCGFHSPIRLKAVILQHEQELKQVAKDQLFKYWQFLVIIWLTMTSIQTEKKKIATVDLLPAGIFHWGRGNKQFICFFHHFKCCRMLIVPHGAEGTTFCV